MGFLQLIQGNSLILNVNILAVIDMDQSCGIRLFFSVILDREGVTQKKDRGGGGGGGGGDYLRAAIISNILTKMWRLFESGD